MNKRFNTRPSSGLSNQILTFALFAALLIGAMHTLGSATARADGAEPQTTPGGQQFNSGVSQVSLVELYTSEGCSSCPPADRWLSRVGTSDAIWNTVVPIAFHVSYWDRLGWPDRFAQRQFDTRQRLLAARADSGVYTPGMFHNGAEFRSWRRTPPQSIKQAIEQQASDVGDLQLRSIGNDRWQVTFTPVRASLPDDAQVFVAVLGNGLNNDVSRGENAGKLLEHDFVVLNLESAALQPASSSDDGSSRALQATFKLDTTITERPALAAWVVDASGQPLQAVGGELASSIQLGSQAGG